MPVPATSHATTRTKSGNHLWPAPHEGRGRRQLARSIVTVHHGVVTLTGTVWADGHHDLLPLALRMIWDTDGVVDVVNQLGETKHRVAPQPPRPSIPPSSRDN